VKGAGRRAGVWCSALGALVVACTSAPPPPPPQFTAVPAAVLEVMCARIHDEGIARETTVDVVRTPRPLVTRQSLQAMAEVVFYQGRIDQRAVESAYGANERILPVPGGSGCSWNAVEASARRSHDTMTLELSAPFLTPFGNRTPGVLARLALGGEAATWYWIPLANRNGTWVAGMVMPLANHE
jgi:hypothetical protein